MGEEFLFLFEYPVCQVVPGGEAQEAAVPAFAFEKRAGVGVVADGCALPHVVHGPDDRFARLEYFLYVADGEHSLVNPVKMYDVGFAERRQAGYVEAGVGNGDGEEVFPAEKVVRPDNQSFEEEGAFLLPVLAHRNH